MVLYKKVNGQRVEMSSEEEIKLKAEWAENSTKFEKRKNLIINLQQAEDLKKKIEDNLLKLKYYELLDKLDSIKLPSNYTLLQREVVQDFTSYFTLQEIIKNQKEELKNL